MLSAKALSGGFVPVGAILMRRRVFDALFSNMVRAPVQSTTYGQGHLGIIMHPRTVKRICARAHEWIQTL